MRRLVAIAPTAAQPAASLYARSTAFIRVWYPAPPDLNHSKTSASIRSDTEALLGTTLRPRRAMPRATCFRSNSGCSAEIRTSRSVIDRGRRKLVFILCEEDFCFITSGQPFCTYIMYLQIASASNAGYRRLFRAAVSITGPLRNFAFASAREVIIMSAARLESGCEFDLLLALAPPHSQPILTSLPLNVLETLRFGGTSQGSRLRCGRCRRV